jgi:hypothetical protein
MKKAKKIFRYPISSKVEGVEVNSRRGSLALREVRISIETDFALTKQESLSLSNMLADWVQSIAKKHSPSPKNSPENLPRTVLSDTPSRPSRGLSKS